jgi:hypothetical protein
MQSRESHNTVDESLWNTTCHLSVFLQFRYHLLNTAEEDKFLRMEFASQTMIGNSPLIGK